MDSATTVAVNQVADLSKQLLTLATGTIAITISLGKDLFQSASPSALKLLRRGWLYMLTSVLAGIWTLMALAGSIVATTADHKHKIFELNVRIPSCIQILLFLYGSLLIIRYASSAAFAVGAANKTEAELNESVPGRKWPRFRNLFARIIRQFLLLRRGRRVAGTGQPPFDDAGSFQKPGDE
jgi:hypothetical protein